MSSATAQEQYLLELINEARINPMGNAGRYVVSYDGLVSSDSRIQIAINQFGVSGPALRAAYASLTPAAPLAWNDSLAKMASNHNQSMIKFDTQTHQTPEEGALGQRATEAGYQWQSVAENVYSYAFSMIYAHAGFMVDWGTGANGMQDPAKHRISIMNPAYREVGLSVTAEDNPATSVGPLVVTQDFGARTNAYFVTGVAYRDTDLDRFYSIGEGVAGLVATVGARSDTSGAAGGYAVEVARGSGVAILLSGGGLASTVNVTTTIAQNLKLDIVDGTTLLTTGSIAVEGPVSTIRAIGHAAVDLAAGGGNQTIHATAQNDTLTGGQGNDTLFGYSGVDTAVLAGTRAQYSIAQATPGVFQVTGPDGLDTLHNIEYLRFADQTIRLLPGTGTLVDFERDAPVSYMANISDFDGTSFGNAANWRLIGQVDVNGDGDVDRVLINPALGRFAEVAVASDGMVYFQDHGWGGETRVVGIYVDPLVASGQVQQGGPNDSQRRFQNDLMIGNIGKILGAGDYDHNGFQEIYFALTDGTAYLHAYMHADGNIQYANYQSQQQVIDYLTQNGWASGAWAGWFG